MQPVGVLVHGQLGEQRVAPLPRRAQRRAARVPALGQPFGERLDVDRGGGRRRPQGDRDVGRGSAAENALGEAAPRAVVLTGVDGDDVPAVVVTIADGHLDVGGQADRGVERERFERPRPDLRTGVQRQLGQGSA